MHVVRPGPLRHRLAAALVLLALLAGCGGKEKLTNPIPKPPPPPSPYPELINPYSVLDALRIAYEARDTTEIKLLYDNAYQGSSLDQTDPSPITLVFTKADEVAHVAALARTAAVLNISLTQAQGLIRFHATGDPPGWTTILNPFTSLDISEAAVVRHVALTSEGTLFTFVPSAPNPALPDTTWKIVRWIEVRN
jgi:hypothetical protein